MYLVFTAKTGGWNSTGPLKCRGKLYAIEPTLSLGCAPPLWVQGVVP